MQENQQNCENNDNLPEGTKRCPYCAETILAAAIKCRYCGEFLNQPLKTAPEFPELHSETATQTEKQNKEEIFEFKTAPSLWAISGGFFKTIIAIAIISFFMFWPIAQLLKDFNISENIISAVLKYRVIAGTGFIVLFALILIYKILKLKSVSFLITPDRVEWSRGIFDRRVDNIDMFRVVDLRLQRSFLDCILQIGTVVLLTNDRSDPEFYFNKIRRPKQLYDVIKKASLSADAKRGVVHLE